MKIPSSLRLALTAGALLTGLTAFAQLDISLSAIHLANAGLPSVNVTLNGSVRTGLPSPLVIASPGVPLSAQWFCLDPGQTIFHSGSGEPGGNELHYASTNPANFNLWGLNAPGLSAPRVQDLADLFQAYLPLANTALNLGALQLAVWEIANEANGNSYSLTTGFLRVASTNGTSANALISTATLMLASLDTAAVMNRGNTASLDFLIDGTYWASRPCPKPPPTAWRGPA
jgi:hypothetical protein